MHQEDSRNYKVTPKSHSQAEQVCYCCGRQAVQLVHADGFPGSAQIGVCMLCAGGQFVFREGYLVYDCPFCGSADIKGMVDYWWALQAYNKKNGTKKTGIRVKWGVNWKEEMRKIGGK